MAIALSKYRPRFSVSFAGKDITADITEDIISLEYCDYLDGQSDEVTVALYNSDLKWCNQWYPEKGDALQLGLGYHNGDFVQYPDCELDAPQYGFKPDTVSLRALSTGVSKSVRTRTPKLYTNTTLADIAKVIAKRNKLGITGEILNVGIDKVAQYMERDLEFLLRVAKTYNHTFKIVGTKLVFTHKPDLLNQPPVRVIDYSEVISLSLQEKLKDTVSVVDVAYQNPKKKQKQQKRYRKKGVKKGTVSGDTLKINRRGADEHQTGQQAQAAINEANEDRCVGQLDYIGDPKLVAGVTIELTGIGKLSGKFFINSSRHVFGRDSGYQTSCEIKRVYPEDELEEVPNDE